MNNFFRFFDYFYLKVQADIVVYNWKRKMKLPIKMQHQFILLQVYF